MLKNVASQLIIVHAVDKTTGLGKAGDASNITAYLSKDGGAATATNDTNPTELSPTNMIGDYAFTMTQAESNCDILRLNAVSATANVLIEKVTIYTIDYSTLFTSQMTESYAAKGVAPTPAQALFAIQQLLADFSIEGVTKTVTKIDGSTTAMTYTHNDDKKPTSVTRTT